MEKQPSTDASMSDTLAERSIHIMSEVAELTDEIKQLRAEIERLISEQKKAESEIWMPKAEIRVLQELLKDWVELDNRGSASDKLIDISRIMLGMENGRP